MYITIKFNICMINSHVYKSQIIPISVSWNRLKLAMGYWDGDNDIINYHRYFRLIYFSISLK